MGWKGVAIGAGLVFVAGVAIGSATGPTPETKIVKVPTVETRIEYRDKPASQQVWPESCQRAVELIEASTINDSEITGAAGNILLSLQDLTQASVIEPQTINPIVQEIRIEKNHLDQAVIDRKEALSTAQFNIEMCLAALEK